MLKKVIIFVLLLFFGGVSSPMGAENDAPAKTDPARAEVTKTDHAPEPMKDIHDIKPVEETGFDPALLLYIIAGLVIAMLIGGLIYYLLRRSKNKITTVEPTLLPEETARRLLDGLSVFDTMPAREFYFQLSTILRGYIKDRFNINAPEMTTEELLPRIEKIDMDRKLRKDVKKLLSTADPIKFAGLHAACEQMGKDLLFAKIFVKSTTSDTTLPMDES
ncbi:MAG: hypothetical protein JRI38_07715 [Deltaproteobacteria bacterium]|nr:hypothetical protein [Deltaproteobacteria bacterium]